MAPEDPSEVKTEAILGIENAVVSAFRESLKSVTDEVVEQYEVEIAAESIAQLVSLDAFEKIPGDIIQYLSSVFIESGDDALGQLDITDIGIFNIVHEDALVYAKDRAAELVGRKIVAGQLIENPDARWAINEATRDGIRALIERAYAEGLTVPEVKKELKASYGFSEARAKLIAKTETAKASVQGSIDGWKKSGIVEGKSSLLSDDHDKDDECNDNENDGVIAIDALFSSGDDGPPYHPGCNCTLVAELTPEEEEM